MWDSFSTACGDELMLDGMMQGLKHLGNESGQKISTAKSQKFYYLWPITHKEQLDLSEVAGEHRNLLT